MHAMKSEKCQTNRSEGDKCCAFKFTKKYAPLNIVNCSFYAFQFNSPEKPRQPNERTWKRTKGKWTHRMETREEEEKKCLNEPHHQMTQKTLELLRRKYFTMCINKKSRNTKTKSSTRVLNDESFSKFLTFQMAINYLSIRHYGPFWL